MPEVARKLRITSSADIASLVPMLFEYQPYDSVVVLAVDGGRVGKCMRADVQPPQDIWAAVGEYFPINPDSVTSILVVIYDPRPSYAADILEGLRVGYDVKDAIRVHDGRWFPVLCTDPICCPTQGGLVEAVSPEMTVALGLEPTASSREELRDRYAACDPVTLDSLVSLYPEPVADGVQRFAQIRALLDDGTDVPDSSVGRMLVNLTDVHIRDGLIASAMATKTERVFEEVFAYLARRAPAGFVAPPATAAGVLAWQSGSGTRARIAAETALSDDETYTLARLLEQILDCGMDPSVGREPLTELIAGD